MGGVADERGGMTMRLYLLDYGGRPLAIEVDIDVAPETMDQLSTVLDSFTVSFRPHRSDLFGPVPDREDPEQAEDVAPGYRY